MYSEYAILLEAMMQSLHPLKAVNYVVNNVCLIGLCLCGCYMNVALSSIDSCNLKLLQSS